MSTTTPANVTNPAVTNNVWMNGINGGTYWDTPGANNTAIICYYLAGAGDGFYNWFSGEVTAINNAMLAYESVANIDFQFNNSLAQAEIIWASVNTSMMGSNAYGSAYLPGDYFNSSVGEYQSPIFINWQVYAGGLDLSGLAVGGFDYITLIHELGHALGMDHSHDGVRFPGVTSAFGDYGNFNMNQGMFTTMGYNDGWVTQLGSSPSVDYGWQSTPMALDIAWLQAVYGANMSYHTGNDTYILGTSALSCIWDAGGTDTIQYNGSSSVTIDLRPATLANAAGGGGFVSWVSGGFSAFTIANGVVIENATGGSGNDTIILSSANVNNLINGSGGFDTVHVSYAFGTGYTVSGTPTNLTLSGAAGTDTFQGVETFIFSNGTQISAGALISSGLPDLTAGSVVVSDTTPGADQNVNISFQIANISGGNAGASTAGVYFSTDVNISTADTLLGSVLIAALAANTSTNATLLNALIPGGATVGVTYYIGVIADDGNFVLNEASEGNNASSGTSIVISDDPIFTEGDDSQVAIGGPWHALGGDDTMIGGSGVDILHGDDGDDILFGLGGPDQLFGGNGLDTVSYSASSLGVTVNLALKANVAQTSAGDASGDTLSFLENVIGSQHADTITGSKGANVLDGLGGNDNIMGGNGNDVLSGGLGEDTLNGGKNDDILHGGDQNDTLIGDSNNDQLFGGGDNDNLDGGKNNDMLDGGSGDDILFGNNNDDILIGGTGNDTLTGGKNNDHFLFDVGFGQDMVTDFAVGNKITDVIEFDSAVFASFNDILANSQQSAANVVITTTGGDTLTLQNVQLSALVSGHFLIT